MSDTVPTQHTAGDSFACTLPGGDYPATAGWAVQLVLIGPTRITLNSTASGADHALAVTAATTASWAPGEYATRVLYVNAGSSSRVSGAAGTLRVLPDPAAGGTTAAVIKSPAQQLLQLLEAAYTAYASSGNFHVQQYTVDGRTMQYRTVEELLRALNAARRDVAAENAAAQVAAGINPRQRYVVRM